MADTDPRIDAYIAKSGAFAQPILQHLRQAVAQTDRDREAMGQFGRIAAVQDLPPKAELVRRVKKAAALVDSGEKPARVPRPSSGWPEASRGTGSTRAAEGGRAS